MSNSRGTCLVMTCPSCNKVVANVTSTFIVAFSFTKDAYEEAARAKSEELGIKLLTVEQVVKGFTK
mgnify:CR=1 FL=1